MNDTTSADNKRLQLGHYPRKGPLPDDANDVHVSPFWRQQEKEHKLDTR
jgi:hypothetical protein